MPFAIADIYATLDHPPNAEQREAIETLDGPLRIIAGPGSGKTHVLVLRTLNLIACEGVPPSDVVVVTFTEKAARELEDRIRTHATRLEGALPHLAELNVGTIHWFAGVVLRRHHPRLRRYEPLDELGQKLFIYQRLDELCDDLMVDAKYLGKWRSKSRAITSLIPWLGKVTEETITPGQLEAESDVFLNMLGVAYRRYREALLAEGYLDFSFILRELHDLLVQDEQALEAARSEYSHFMIDEYQDTNYVQEEILLQLSAPEFNVAVVGDDDQSLYRFRGATVRNILEFADRLVSLGVSPAETALEVNYRSHPTIIDTYLDFMRDGDWEAGGRVFRTGHDVRPDPDAAFQEYEAAAHLRGSPRQLANLVKGLLDSGVVEDASQVALLFYSVSADGAEVIDELRRLGIDCYAPRARRFLDHLDVRDAIGVLWALAGFADEDDSRPDSGPVAETCAWAASCLVGLLQRADDPLRDLLTTTRSRLDTLEHGEDMAGSLLDLFYRSLRHEPFTSHLNDATSARNIGYVTTLLRTFQQQFGFEVLHAGNRSFLPWRLWASFFYMLESTGVDDLEAEDLVPAGHVRVLTIHQSKGLEFPVTIVGSLDRTARSQKEIDRTLGHLYPRGSFEPEGRITEFDWRRLFYVAMSRAKHLTITHSEGEPHRFFRDMVDRLPSAKDLDLKSISHAVPSESLTDEARKPLFSLTSQINVIRRCTRQYAFFKEYGFAPSFAAQVFFGTVVHQTIEDIHRHVLDGRPEPLSDELIDQYFERNSELLRKRGIHPLAPNQRDEARAHVQRYYDANRDSLDDVIDTEVEVLLEQPDYVLNGRVDLIRADDGAVEMVDFKAQHRIESGPDYDQYRDQLALYAHLLESRYGERPDRAVLYFTGESDATTARKVVDIDDERIEEVLGRFDNTAQQILAKDFELVNFPPRDTCRACDFKHYCRRSDDDPDADPT